MVVFNALVFNDQTSNPTRVLSSLKWSQKEQKEAGDGPFLKSETNGSGQLDAPIHGAL